MTKNYGNCWHCGNNKILKLCKSVDSLPYFKKHIVLICKSCGLIYKNHFNKKINNKINYYQSDSYKGFKFNDLLNRSKERAFVDVNRYSEYIQHIEKYLDLNKKIKILDIGGAEGLFCSTIKSKYPKVEVYCLEPDLLAIKVGKKLYPNINFINKKLEEMNKNILSKIDLVTYWGGFYRTREPLKAINILKSITKNESMFFFSFPATLCDTRLQGNEANKSLSFLLAKQIYTHLDKDYIKSFFNHSFKILNYSKIQNYPFLKMIPLLVMKNINNTKVANTNIKLLKDKKFWLNKYDYNINFLKNYAKEESLKNLKEIKSKYKFKNISIWIGENTESKIFIDICEKLKLNILYFFSKEQVGKSLIHSKKISKLSKIYKKKSDILFVTDVQNQNLIIKQLIERLHLNNVMPIAQLYKDKNNSDSMIKLANKMELNKVFDFKIYF